MNWTRIERQDTNSNITNDAPYWYHIDVYCQYVRILSILCAIRKISSLSSIESMLTLWSQLNSLI